MSLLEIIYLCGAVAFGLIIGMIVEMFIDAETISDLQAQNRKLRLELAQERKTPTVIEINDNRTKDAEIIDFSQKW